MTLNSSISDSPIAALVVDDHPFLRRGVADYLTRQGFAVTEAGDVHSGLAAAQTHRPRVAVLDIVIPLTPDASSGPDPAHGLELGKRLKHADPALGLVFLSSYMHYTSGVYDLLRDGHRGLAYKSKTSPPTELLAALQHVLTGGIHVDPDVLADQRLLVDELRAHFTPEEAPWIERVARGLAHAGLTPREADIATRVAAARTIRRIADELQLAPATVESHIHHLYEKLGLHQLAAHDIGLRPDVILAKACTLHDLQKWPSA